MPLLNQLRAADVATEVHPDLAKVKKMLDYTNAKQIPYVVLIGSDEVQTGQLSLKNMLTGQQRNVSAEKVVSLVQK